MSQTYEVKQGDCVSSLSARFGFANYQTIWNHASNAELRKRRSNPNHLFPGDLVYIPDIVVRTAQCATDQSHRFILRRPMVRVRVKLLDRERKPYSNKKYRLSLYGISKTYNGTTNDAGLLDEKVPATSTSGKLALWLQPEEGALPTFETILDIGHLDPIDETTGIQARLNHLGYDCGDIDGVYGPDTASSLSRFQRDVGLPELGEINGPTRDKLRELFDTE